LTPPQLSEQMCDLHEDSVLIRLTYYFFPNGTKLKATPSKRFILHSYLCANIHSCRTVIQSSTCLEKKGGEKRNQSKTNIE